MSRSSASSERTGSLVPSAAPARFTMCFAMSGMSPRRSRSGGMHDLHDAQSIVEILAEAPVGHHLLEILVRRGDDARLRLLGALGAHGLEFAVLNDAQQLALEVERGVADLVEEDRALAGEREAAAPRLVRAGERAAHVTEQLRLEQRVRERPRS